MRHSSSRSVPGVAADGVPVPRFRARYPATPSSVGVIRGEVEAVARECGLEGEELGDVCLAVSEAATNAVVHGSVGCEDAHIGLSVELTDSEMFVTVRDEGNGFRPRKDSPGIGAGLFIVAAVTGHLDVRTSAEGAEVRMTFPFPLTTANQQHDNAVQRLDAALVEQDRMGERFDAAVGTSTELGAYARLQAAGEQVTAREAWVAWVDDESYRGLNAGPFELRAESKTATRRRATPHTTAAARPRRETHDRARRTINARRAVPRPGVGGRAWLNGREVGGVDPRYTHLEPSHD